MTTLGFSFQVGTLPHPPNNEVVIRTATSIVYARLMREQQCYPYALQQQPSKSSPSTTDRVGRVPPQHKVYKFLLLVEASCGATPTAN